MRKASALVALVVASVITAGCGRRVPEPSLRTRGEPYVSWIIMSGDRDNPDEEFVCQSSPRNDCVVPVSRPDAQVFSDVHMYYHAAGVDTRYVGSIQIGFFRGTNDAHTLKTDIKMQKNESITNQSVTGIVSSTLGTYVIDFALVATGSGTDVPIRMQVPVVVR